MKFTFKSEQYGTVVEMSFEGVTLSEIEEMYKQFLRGSGFYLVEDEDNVSTKQQNVDTSEECVHEVDMSYRPGGLTVDVTDLIQRAIDMERKECAEMYRKIMDDAILREREACAKLLENKYTNGDNCECWLESMAEEIRGRTE